MNGREVPLPGLRIQSTLIRRVQIVSNVKELRAIEHVTKRSAEKMTQIKRKELITRTLSFNRQNNCSGDHVLVTKQITRVNNECVYTHVCMLLQWEKGRCSYDLTYAGQRPVNQSLVTTTDGITRSWHSVSSEPRAITVSIRICI